MEDCKYLFVVECSTEAKKKIIQECDEAFAYPICMYHNFDELFLKIDKYAEFIAVYNEDLLGYAAMYANNYESGIAYITLIAVKRKYQNKHIGKALLDECCRMAKDKGLKKIKLEVRKDNEVALSFYRKNGFKVIEEASENSYYMLRSFGEI